MGASVPEDFYFPDYEESTLLDGCNRPNFAYNKHSQAPPPVFQPVLALRAVPSRISLRCFLLQHPDCFVQNVDVTDVLMSASVPCCFVDRSVSRTSLTGDVLSRLKSRASQGSVLKDARDIHRKLPLSRHPASRFRGSVIAGGFRVCDMRSARWPTG